MMNYIGSLLLLAIGCTVLNFSHAACGNQNLVTKTGRHTYESVGNTQIERCKWTFSYAKKKNAILILNIKTFFPRGRSPNRAFLKLPNGTKLDSTNARQYVNKCVKYLPKDVRPSNCLKNLANKNCAGPFEKVDKWPPTLSSEARYAYQNRNASFVYPVDIVFHYRFVNCTDVSGPNKIISTNPTTQSIACADYYSSTVALSCLVVLLALMCGGSSFLLWKKIQEEKRAKELLAACNKTKTLDSIYENPNNLKTELISTGNTYSNIGEHHKADDCNDTYAVIPATQVVSNVLYHSFKSNSESSP